MATYLPLTEKGSDRSRREARKRGAGMQAGAVTKHYHKWIVHPITRQEALVIENLEHERFLTTGELSSLLDQSAADAAGWFLSFDLNI